MKIKPRKPYVVATKVSQENNRAAFGITDGKLWFFYAYVSEKEAADVCENICNDAEKIRVNISQPCPMKIVPEE